MKRLFDVVVALLGGLVLSPLLAALALLVRTSSPGPALYWSRRVGRSGRPFDMLKFRTMHVGVPDTRNADGSTYNAADDPRATPVGRWLRRTSLDELPQLWNVIRGDMSLVGPRPDLPDQVAFYTESDFRRLEVRPGITGLAQVSGRNDLTWEKRRALDLRYIAARSFWLDMSILLQTLPGVLHMRGVFVPSRESSGHVRPRR